MPGALMVRVMRDMAGRGETPFLHCWSSNETAIALYRKLGFEIRARTRGHGARGRMRRLIGEGCALSGCWRRSGRLRDEQRTCRLRRVRRSACTAPTRSSRPRKPTAVLRYADHPRGFAELRMPEGKGPFPLAVIFHGGCFKTGIADQNYMAPLATRWQQLGVATLNVDYREVGDGGGWPGSFEDWRRPPT